MLGFAGQTYNKYFRRRDSYLNVILKILLSLYKAKTDEGILGAFQRLLPFSKIEGLKPTGVCQALQGTMSRDLLDSYIVVPRLCLPLDPLAPTRDAGS